MNTRSRAFTLRVDLLPSEQQSWLPRMKSIVESYPTRFTRLLIGGPELAPTTGLRHVHVYVEFDNQRKTHQVTPLLHLVGLTNFITPAKKADYARIRDHHTKLNTKEDSNVCTLLEFPEPIETTDCETDTGARVFKRQKCTMDDVRAVIESTGDIEAVKNLNYAVYMRHSGFIDKECSKYRPKTEDVKYEHLWIHGPPDTGKTAVVHLHFPDAHYQDVCNPNFEDYNGQSEVVFNDFDNKTLRLFTVAKLKNLCDPSGTKCKVNYGTVNVKAQIIVTSNFSIFDAFQYKGKARKWEEPTDETDVDYLAIKRRFKEITIKKYLFQNDIQLRSKHDLAQATSVEECFEPYSLEPRSTDAYSECNQSVKSHSSTISDSTAAADEPTPWVQCNLKSCTAPGMWTGEGLHLHYK